MSNHYNKYTSIVNKDNLLKPPLSLYHLSYFFRVKYVF